MMSLPDYRPMAAWFEAAPVTHDPSHITYVVNAHMLDPTRRINPDRAKVDCDAVIQLESDGPIVVSLAGCSKPANTVHATARR
jgi:hypothetical protein